MIETVSCVWLREVVCAELWDRKQTSLPPGLFCFDSLHLGREHSQFG